MNSAKVQADRPTEWLSPAQLADELQIPLATIYIWRSRHKGPRGHKIGTHVRYSRADVAAWLETLADPKDAA
ncbi:helix-turn-helix domain-containing protein [Arthrobacter sp. efr-133-R2A-120]|uniref:helix-turn-helix domain-containing protein n=1 Tax=Arthrobacter sp. efr-133-R2A-120 TaxID=3040277 RepID=UPI00254AC636|nr:helix-turn-helix domain-containing protein [Arthrobacter sp. efr-133-R2A-120]